MDARVASRTALGVVAHRAIHQLFDAPPKILDDPIAPSLLDEGARAALAARPAWIDDPAARQLRTHLVLRARYAEDCLREATLRGVRRYVILGAGYDSFACRQPAWARDLQILEVDHPATQADKKARLSAAGVGAPDNLVFIPVDFETASLAEALATNGVGLDTPTFFSCLGVLVYLTQEAADGIFELVSRFAAGSEIVYSFSQSLEGATAARAAAAGEPWLNRSTTAELTQRLRGFGFSPASFLTPAEARRSYFPRPRSDGLAAPRRTTLGRAIVDEKCA